MIEIDKLDIVPYPHPALRWKSKPIKEVTPLVKDLVKKMISLMHEYKGAGLSANQVAVPWRIFVTFINDKELVFINPIVHLGKNKKDTKPRILYQPEGCLSFPGLKIEDKIPRSKDVYIEALNIDGKPFIMSGAGWFARVVLHEIDHINGILFVDHVNDRVFVDKWCHYLSCQYEFSRYNNKEEEEKLLKLESLA